MNKLLGLHPRLAESVRLILAEMALRGHPMFVTDGLRTEAQQAVLFAQGRTAPGRIVTNCDGIVKRSNHQAGHDGMGRAVDCTFMVAGKASWDAALPWTIYGNLAHSYGLKWGGDPGFVKAGLIDLPHIELPKDIA